MKILLYGNCQTYSILKTLNLDKDIIINNIECFKTDIKEDEFKTLINTSDIIITQPISDNYRDKIYLSTSYILQNKNNNCKVIMFDSCYFNFYYFDLCYKHVNVLPNDYNIELNKDGDYVNFNDFDLSYKYYNKNILHNPIDYHYNEMINCYKHNKNINYYIHNIVNNIDLKEKEELEHIAIDSLNNLYNRYISNKKLYNINNIYYIPTYKYIKENYKNKLLFYSMNHPSKYLIQYICEQIIDILQLSNTIDYTIDILDNPKCIIYKCIMHVC
jgi:hypothetical protein